MAKTNASFKLSKTAKRMVALMKGTQEQRNGWKRMFIDAEYSASIVPKTTRKDRTQTTVGTE